MDRHNLIPIIKTDEIPGPNSKKWIDYHKQFAAEATYEETFVWDRSQPAIGPWAYDPDNNLWLDFAGHIAVNAVGYNHHRLIEVGKLLGSTDPDRYAGTDFIGAWGPYPQYSGKPLTPTHLHKELMSITPEYLNKAFFSNSGAEAVENAMKLAYRYKKNYGYGICFNGAFHGRTLGALSLNRSKHVQRRWYPEIPNIISLDYNDPDCFLKLRVEWAEIAFVIVEPIQGEGGYVVPSVEWMQHLRTICSACDIPLIMDEIQSGLGRTGKWWCFEYYDIVPDILTSAKALRIGATIANEKYFPTQQGRISSTWGEGNALSSAMGALTIQIIKEERLLENTYKNGAYFRNRLEDLGFENVRGKGLMSAFDIENHNKRNSFVRRAAGQGLLVIGCGVKSIRLLPPLNVTKREIDICLNIFDDLKKN
jgi:4-aminobutyrate aminotransferase